MLRPTFTEIEKQALAYERAHHPHHWVRRKMDVLWLKSRGLAHQNIARLAGVSPKALRSYFQDYRQGGIAAIRELTGLIRSPTQVRLFLKDQFDMRRS